MTINAMETGNIYTVLSTPGDGNKVLETQFDVLLNNQFENLSEAKHNVGELFDVLTTLAKNNDPDSIGLLMQIACKPDTSMGVSDLTACEARNRLMNIYENSEPDSHRAALIEQAAIALYDQSDKQGKLPYDVLTFALHASLRVGDIDTVERIIDLLMPLDPLLAGEKITAGQSIDLIDLNEDEEQLIENLNARKMGNAAAFEDELQDELGFKIPEIKPELLKKLSPQVTERVQVESQFEEEVYSGKPKPFVPQTQSSLISPMVSQISPKVGGLSIVEQPLSGGIGGGKLGEVSEFSQVSKQPLVHTVSTQSSIGSEIPLSTPQNSKPSLSSMSVEPLSGGIGGGKLGEVSEFAQISKQPLVHTVSTQSSIGSEIPLGTPQNSKPSLSSMSVEPLSGGIGDVKLSEVSERSLVYVPSVEAKQSHQQARLEYADYLNSVLKDSHKS